MADEETNEETTEQQTPEPEAPAEDVPSDDAAVEETPAEELAEDAGDAVEETSDEELADAADEPEAVAAASPEGERSGAEGDGDEPKEQLSPTERRRRKRSAHSGEARPQRGVEERIAERAEKRRRNAEVRRRYRARSKEKRQAEGPRGGPREGTPPAERAGTGSPRVRQGLVVSDGGDKTITVRIDFARQHRTYGKIVRTSSKLHAHDERNEANTGDTVRVVESRPLSRSKRWRLVEVVDKAR